jgi:hypothetical protein
MPAAGGASAGWLAAASVLTVPSTVAGSLRCMLHADAPSMLMRADHGGIDPLDSRILCGGECIYDTAPDTGLPPANEAV